MKTARESLSLIFRLSITAAAMLLSQHALALGTDAGTLVSNTALVDYTVGLIAQPQIGSSPSGNTAGAGTPTTFLVDRRVDFTLVEVGGAPTTPVAPGQLNVVTIFRLTNTGNAIMDFRLVADNYTGVLLVHGNPDTADMVNFRTSVANGQGVGGTPILGTDEIFVDELAEDAVVDIWVYADAPGTVLNGQYANIELTATAADDLLAADTPGFLDDDLVDSGAGADDPLVIDNVFADDPELPNPSWGDGIEVAQDSYEIIAAASLVITKAGSVISDPFSSGKAVPGAVIEYTITIDNTTGAAAATGIVITDTIQTPAIDLEGGVYDIGVTDSNVLFNPSGTFCIADADPSDGCTYIGSVLSIDVPDVAATASGEVRFQVMIATSP